MNRATLTLFAILALCLLGADAPQTGSIDGKVVNKNDQPLGAINLRLFSTQIQAAPGQKMPAPQSTFGSTQLGGAGQGKPIASTNTAQDGTFKFDHIAPGTYQLIVAPTATTGAFQQNVKVDANQPSHLQIKLSDPQQK